MELLSQTLSILMLVLGFGFVIFWHELGHFLAAKYVGIKVEQFAVGFGQALLAWRKGIGVRVGTTTPRMDQAVIAERARLEAYATRGADGEMERITLTDDQIRERLGIGETEYRLNWIPLGGYVKMLGQDDLKPGVTEEDPRAYNKKSIGARMIVVSAGVVMNVILAAIGFMVVFMMGFNAPPPVVGSVIPNSPAQFAGLQVGDRIISIDGTTQHDFTKISLTAALAKPGEPMPTVIQRPGVDENITLQLAAQRLPGDPNGLLGFGIGFPPELRGPDSRLVKAEALEELPAESRILSPGDTITAVNGKPVEIREYAVLDRAIQQAFGKPVEITVVNEQGQARREFVIPHFQPNFGQGTFGFAGLAPRVTVESVDAKSPAKDKLQPGDAIVSITFDTTRDRTTAPSIEDLQRILNDAGRNNQTVTMEVQREGSILSVAGLSPSVQIGPDKRGLNIGLSSDESNAVIADVPENSTAHAAGLRGGETITAINDSPVENWFDIHRLLSGVKTGEEIRISIADRAEPLPLVLSEDDAREVAAVRYTHRLPLHERVEPRIAGNPLEAAMWGVTETRDFILQFYLTLQRMVQGSVSHKNLMGPVGIVYAGSRFAFKGNDWLIWFLAMISANLAVVNFLPIPIVDGGLFLFLIVEKIQGRPLSPKTQSIAQVIGLALILGVFLLVTYQDIARFFI